MDCRPNETDEGWLWWKLWVYLFESCAAFIVLNNELCHTVGLASGAVTYTVITVGTSARRKGWWTSTLWLSVDMKTRWSTCYTSLGTKTCYHGDQTDDKWGVARGRSPVFTRFPELIWPQMHHWNQFRVEFWILRRNYWISTQNWYF